MNYITDMNNFFNNPNNAALIDWLNEREIGKAEFYHEFINSDDFYITLENEQWRFVDSTEINNVQCDELASDDYILGCFDADFLSGITGIPRDAIAEIQNADCYRALGIILRTGNYIPKLQQAYVKADGYGHHFAHYDFFEHRLIVYHKDVKYMLYAFRIN